MESTEFRRTQFTFYSSYFESIQKLPKSRQYEALQALIRYALYGTTPQSLSPKVDAVFEAFRPNLDASRAKALYRIRAEAEAKCSPSGSK